MESFDIVKTLGRGAFATVYLVRRKSDGQSLVVKKFHRSMEELNAKDRQEVAQEIKLQAHLSHENIVRFVDSFVDDGVMHILMEYAPGGTLFRRVIDQDGKLFDEEQIWEWFIQILLALKYVHSRNVLHRDLKTQNIMLGGASCSVIKLGDFGIAKVLGSAGDMAATVVGTPQYLSPELCQGHHYDQKSDVWALGCVLYELCALRKPFDGTNLPSIILSIMRSTPPPIPPTLSQELRDMVELLLQPAAEDRPTVNELFDMETIQYYLQRWQDSRRRLLDGGTGGVGDGSSMVPGPSLSSPKNTASSTYRSRENSNTNDDLSHTDTDSVAAVDHDRYLSEDRFIEELRELCEHADAEAEADKLELKAQLRLMDDKLTKMKGLSNGGKATGRAGGPGVGRMWEAMGRAWAEAGEFVDAIKAYRLAIRSSHSTASLGAMEQLGNLLVRSAVRLWQNAEGGKEDQYIKKLLAQEESKKVLLNRSASSLIGLGHRRSKSRRMLSFIKSPLSVLDEVVAPSEASPSGSAPTGTPTGSGVDAGGGETVAGVAVAVAGGAGAPFSGSEEACEDDPEWRILAYSLMTEGVGLLERLCVLGETAERRCLLGSAYKRQAWVGLGESRQADLATAAQAYAAAHRLELEEGDMMDGVGHIPSPYARLNQVTLEVLAGSGKPAEKARLLAMVKQAQEWALKKRELQPQDVWLWVQSVDAACLRCLLGDPEVPEADVVSGYNEQFAFGASQRVKSSVLDQFSFMITVLRGRIAEESIWFSNAVTVTDEDALFGAGFGSSNRSVTSSPDVKDWLQQLLVAVYQLQSKLLKRITTPVPLKSTRGTRPSESGKFRNNSGNSLTRPSPLSRQPPTPKETSLSASPPLAPPVPPATVPSSSSPLAGAPRNTAGSPSAASDNPFSRKTKAPFIKGSKGIPESAKPHLLIAVDSVPSQPEASDGKQYSAPNTPLTAAGGPKSSGATPFLGQPSQHSMLDEHHAGKSEPSDPACQCHCGCCSCKLTFFCHL